MNDLRYPFLDLGKVNADDAEALKAAACRVIDSGRYVGGEECEAFERELAAYTGTDYAIGVSNGLDALRLILRAYILIGRLEPGDEVIVPQTHILPPSLQSPTRSYSGFRRRLLQYSQYRYITD